MLIKLQLITISTHLEYFFIKLLRYDPVINNKALADMLTN